MMSFSILNKTFYQYLEESFSHHQMKELRCGLNKAYLHIPPGTQEKLPLLFMFHGTTQTALEFSKQTKMNDIANQYGFAVCYLDKNIMINPYKAFDWIESFEKNRDVESFCIAMNKLKDNPLIKINKTFICGLSAGGALASIITEKMPHLIAGSAIIGGLPEGSAHNVNSALLAMKESKKDLDFSIDLSSVDLEKISGRSLKIFILHGNQDKIVHVDNARNNFKVMKELIDHLDDGNDNESIKHYQTKLSNGNKIFKSVNHDRTLEVHYEEIDGMDHVWRGGSSEIKFSDVGNVGNQFDISQKVVSFFGLDGLKKKNVKKVSP